MEVDGYVYPSPLDGVERSTSLDDTRASDGKSLLNAHASSTTKSPAYTTFTPPILDSSRFGFDVHIYFQHSDATELQFATDLHERIRREFPELRIYPLIPRPVGPHPVGMFEVNLASPAEFGAFVAWLVVNRGPLSALVHPNTGDALRDHTQRATWLGPAFPLRTGLLREISRRQQAQQV